MNGQVPCGSASDYQADEREGVVRLNWLLSSRIAGRFRGAHLAIIKQKRGQCRGAQLAIIKQMSGRCPVAQVTIINQMSKQVPATQLVIIKQMSGQVSHGSAGDYQADERADVVWLSWRLSSR